MPNIEDEDGQRRKEERCSNSERYGLAATNEGVARAVACELGRKFDEVGGLLSELSSMVQQWLVDHGGEEEIRLRNRRRAQKTTS